MKVLFVCTGNICRSPTAEAVFRAKAAARGVGGARIGRVADVIAMRSGRIGEDALA